MFPFDTTFGLFILSVYDFWTYQSFPARCLKKVYRQLNRMPILHHSIPILNHLYFTMFVFVFCQFHFVFNRVEAMSIYMEELKRRDEKERRLKRKETMERTLATWNTNGKSPKRDSQSGKTYSRALSR